MSDPASPPSNASHSCRSSERLGWAFVQESYNRERHLIDTIHGLNHQVTATRAALQHAGLQMQNDRIAINTACARLTETERPYRELQVAQARLQNKSHEEGQELRQVQELLNKNHLHTAALEANLDCAWKAHARMGAVIADCVAQEQDGYVTPTLDLGQLMLDLEAKSQRIQDLEAHDERTQRKHAEEREGYMCAMKDQQMQLIELQGMVPAGPYHTAPERGLTRRRKRQRGRARAAEPGNVDATRSEQKDCAPPEPAKWVKTEWCTYHWC
ncbi:MAG: hypothetical protein Q9216_003227 [Gyalolechia sp. 2 TL-2023]